MASASIERKEKRAKIIGRAVRRARDRRTNMSLRELARRSDVAASTLSRIENPSGTESPRVDTLEELATALNCPLYELLGEPVTIEYRGVGDWPDALNGVLVERGGFVTSAERAYIEHVVTLVRQLDIDVPDATMLADDEAFWRWRLECFHRSPTWRAVEALIVHANGLDDNKEASSGLELLVRALVADLTPDEPASALMFAGDLPDDPVKRLEALGIEVVFEKPAKKTSRRKKKGQK